MICLAYILHFSFHFYHRIKQNIFYSLVYIGKCNKCYKLAYLALHYSESDAFLLPGDDLKNTHKPYCRNPVYGLHVSFYSA